MQVNDVFFGRSKYFRSVLGNEVGVFDSHTPAFGEEDLRFDCDGHAGLERKIEAGCQDRPVVELQPHSVADKTNLTVSDSHEIRSIGRVADAVEGAAVNCRARDAGAEHGSQLTHHLENELVGVTHVAGQFSKDVGPRLVGDIASITAHNVGHPRVSLGKLAHSTSIGNPRVETDKAYRAWKASWITGA